MHFIFAAFLTLGFNILVRKISKLSNDFISGMFWGMISCGISEIITFHF